MLSKEEVKHIAKLARLGLSEGEIEKFQKELSSILDYIEKLKEVDVAKVKPTSHSREMENVMRKDHTQISEKFERASKEKISKRLLDLAPETKNGYLKTKSIF